MKKLMLVVALFVVLVPSFAYADCSCPDESGLVWTGTPLTVMQQVVEQKLPTIPPDTIKPLTAEEEATLENKVLKMETAARELSPEALGKAIADLIAARQQAYQALTQDLNAYTQAIQIEGTVLNRDPKTGKFSRVKKQEENQ